MLYRIVALPMMYITGSCQINNYYVDGFILHFYELINIHYQECKQISIALYNIENVC